MTGKFSNNHHVHTLNDIVDTSNKVYRIPTLTGANCELQDDSKLIVETYWSQLDIDRNEKTKFTKTLHYSIDKQNNLNLISKSKPIPVRSDTWQERSNDGSLTAVISEWKDSNESNQFLEIWNGVSKICNKNLTKEDKHGKLYDSTLKWSTSANNIAYIAEKKLGTSLKCLALSGSKAKTDNAPNDLNYSINYTDTWGEQTSNKSQSAIIIYNLETDTFKSVETIPTDICPMNLTWYKDEGIVFTGYYTVPYRLGLVYCPIRRSDLFYYDIEQGNCINLTSVCGSDHNVRSPVFSNDFEKLCFLKNTTMGPHFKCSQLMIMNWQSKQVETLIDVVKEQPDNDQDFPGIYAVNLLGNCWSLDDKRIVFNTCLNHKSRIMCCNVTTKKLTILADDSINDLNYLECLRFSNDYLLALLQGYNKEPTFTIAHLPSVNNESSIKWNTESTSNANKDFTLDSLCNVSLLKFKPNIANEDFPNLHFESILVEPKSIECRNGVLVVFPHGGPHSAFQCEYSQHVAILYILGYSIVLVNYRGSIGYGEQSIDSLPGRIGSQDVQDTQQVAQYCLKTNHYKDVVLYGGSHGGFLATHLIGQYPDFYSSAVVRNPVTSLEVNRATSDIPDWAFTESLGVYDFNFDLSLNDMDKRSELYKKSPIYYIDQVRTPLLFLIGAVDLRVPPSQSIEYFKALKQRNKQTKMLWFKDDCHSLDKPQTTIDCIINAVLWFQTYSKQQSN